MGFTLFFIILAIETTKTMHRYIHIILTLVMLLMPSPMLSGDINQESMCYLNKEKGLAGLTVTKIITDHNGQIWVGTSDGVNRYNGKVLLKIPLDEAQGKRNYINDISEGSDYSIYLAKENGVWQLKPDDSQFRQVFPYISRANAVVATKSVVYVGADKGLYVITASDHRLIAVDRSPMGKNSGVRQVEIDSQGKVWFLTRNLLNVYNPSKGTYKSYSVKRGMPADVSLCRFVRYGDRVYMGTKNNGVFVWNLKDRLATPVKGVGNIVTSMQLAPRGLLALGTNGAGAFLIDMKTAKVVERFSTDEGSKRSLPTNAVYCYYKDKNGVDWFGFYHYGMAYSYYSEDLFHLYTYKDFNTLGTEVNSVYLHSGRRIIGTSKGLYIVDEHLDRIHFFNSAKLGGAHIVGNVCYYKGHYYIGTYDGGLVRINASTMAVSDDPTLERLKHATIGAITIAPDGMLWIGSSDGLFITDGNGNTRRYTEQNSHVIGGCVSSITFSPNGFGWLVGRKGLCLYSPVSRSFVNDGFPAGFFHAEPLTESRMTKDNVIYFVGATTLYYTDEQMKHYGAKELPAPLNEEQILSFLDDRRGLYWISTENGLFCADYNFTQAGHFGNGEGLNCQFITSRMEVDEEGRVWIGTSNGLLYIKLHAVDLWRKRTKFKTVVYDIQKDGDPVGFAEESVMNNHHVMRLTWNFGSQLLSMKPILEDYARPLGRLYEYSIDSCQWCGLRDGESMMLSQLSMGTHSLAIRLAGAPGTTQYYTIRVMPSVWAWTELILLIAALAAGTYGWRFYHRRTSDLLSERNDIEAALAQAQEDQQQAEESLILEKESMDNAMLSTEKETDSMPQEKEKYSRVKIDEDEASRIIQRLRKYMDEDKLYTNPDLKLNHLAQMVNISASRLSVIFSHYLGESYYEFVNHYRLEEFKRLLAEGASEQFTLIALSERCGFKKSNFFFTFRKVEGMTPNEYLKRHGVHLKQQRE